MGVARHGTSSARRDAGWLTDAGWLAEQEEMVTLGDAWISSASPRCQSEAHSYTAAHAQPGVAPEEPARSYHRLPNPKTDIGQKMIMGGRERDTQASQNNTSPGKFTAKPASPSPETLAGVMWGRQVE
ncbi:hypothetical protein P8C59_004735 [Phyllachora maydis]|uniref:Uncharacterized protein n=1 Tax=Phyllachora maydis TaxID=1825666 RepID=A0AAD9I4R0_9PEZI|nr:hypothetical protein P8C59_004735 [Phyllachora maydis]